MLANPMNPFNHTPMARHAAAAFEVFERTTRRYDKPAFGVTGTQIDAITFTNQAANISQGRSPDGSGNIDLLPMPSPRGANESAPPAPVVTGIGVQGATVTLTFTSVPGIRYRVQFKDDLSAMTWSSLPGDVIAVGNFSMKLDTNNGQQRFYRLQIVP